MSFFQSRDGTPLFERSWPLGERAKALVVVVHGYGEHSGRYEHVARGLNEAGFSAFAFDVRGHGQSGGTRGFCRRFEDFIEDIEAALARARSLDGNARLPLFVLGHSHGGLIASHYVLRNGDKLSGLVLSSPFFGFKIVVPPLKRIAGQLASRLYPRLALPAGVAGADVSRDPEIQRAYDDDPLNNKVATARWFTETTAAQEAVLARAGDVALPVLVLQGGADRLADPARTQAVFDRLGSQDKTLQLLAGQYHEVLNEPAADRMRSLAEIITWLDAHAGEKLHSRGA